MIKLALIENFSSKNYGVWFRIFSPNYQVKKERLTVLTFSNESGNDRLLLTLIRKAKRSGAFKNIYLSLVPVNY